MKRTLERRFVKSAEIRAKDDGHIEGHAAVFDEEYVLWDYGDYRVVETVKPGAFKRALKEKQDVRALFNHDANQVLGRSSAKTLTMKEDSQGLYFEATPPDTQVGRDVLTLVKRGDISGCSFAFTVTKETVTEEKENGKTTRRRSIEDVDLYDVGPVTYPAYEGTDVSARSIEMRGLLFPQGVPDQVLALVPELRTAAADEPMECCCGCRACYSAECEECDMHMQQCEEDSCSHDGAASRSVRDDGKKTKRVDGEDLTSGCFLYVGDPDKPETWALPWKFSSDTKIKSHLRNALARFNQTAKIPADKKAGVWKKLAAKCKKYGIKVSDQEANSWNFSAEQRQDLRGLIGSGVDCQCDCPECLVGKCSECSDPDCEDDECDHEGNDDGNGDRAAMLADVDTRLRLAGIKQSA